MYQYMDHIMETTTKSEQAFIDAAGRLFALQGIDGVTTKAIAKAAGIDASMIKYYFGNKEGLVHAVVEQTLRPWQHDNLKKYYEENSALLTTGDGQVVFVNGMVELIFRNFSTSGNDWGRSFVLQLLQRPSPLRDELIKAHLKESIETFCTIYRTITNNADFESALCWYLFLICPLYMYSGCPGLLDLLHPEGAVTGSFERRLQIFTTRQLLDAWGLK